MGAVSSAVLDAGGEVTGIVPYAMVAAGGEVDQTRGGKGPAVLLKEKGREKVRSLEILHCIFVTIVGQHGRASI